MNRRQFKNYKDFDTLNSKTNYQIEYNGIKNKYIINIFYRNSVYFFEIFWNDKLIWVKELKLFSNTKKYLKKYFKNK